MNRLIIIFQPSYLQKISVWHDKDKIYSTAIPKKHVEDEIQDILQEYQIDEISVFGDKFDYIEYLKTKLPNLTDYKIIKY